MGYDDGNRRCVCRASASQYLKGKEQPTAPQPAKCTNAVRRFTDSILALPHVIECHMMAGDCDFLLRVVARDLDAYTRFQAEKLARIDGVQSLKTDIPLQRIKLTAALPL